MPSPKPVAPGGPFLAPIDPQTYPPIHAKVHGNKYNARKRVYLKLEAQPKTLVVTIGDEGDGFNDTDVPDPLAQENLLKQSGRGLLLMRAFMDECEHAPRVPHGTLVRLVKRLAED